MLENGNNGPETAISARELTRYYGDLLAVDHVSFDVNPGELFGFLGPNGAGKTTTISIFMNLIRPSGGTASVFGMDSVADSLSIRSTVGIVPEVSNVFPEITARFNLTFTGALYGMGRKDCASRAAELLELFGLEEHRDKKAGQLSMGLKRRLAIAMSMMHRPGVLFLDEPTSGLDVSSARSIRETVKDLNSRGVTFFLTTHNMEEAGQMCDRIAVIDRGRLIAVDTPERLRQASSESRVVELTIDDKPCQELKAALAAVDAVSRVETAGGSYRLITSNPGDTLHSLFHFLESRNISARAVNTPGPTLEDVFVKLTSGGQSFGSSS